MDSPFRRLAPNPDGATGGKPRRLRWQVPDLIDFDYYVADDERKAREEPAERKRLSERDRRLYKEKIAPVIGDAGAHTATHRNRALRWWLELRRRQEESELSELLPGTAFERGQRLVTYATGIIGFAIGIGVASTLLHYEGQHPVNVSWYLFWLVLVQILLAGTTLAVWYGRGSRMVRGAAQDVSIIAYLIRPAFARAAHWVQHQRLAHVSPELRDRAQARQGMLQSRYTLYGPASYLPILIPAQVFGIGFNIGAILVTITLEWFTDLAFGWGSALNISAGAVHGLTQLIALPWSWLLGEGVGYPTLEQIAGTRISLKDPLFVLNAEHLRSWRWFLVLAVITYGLLPRVILLGLSAHKQRRALAALPFTHQSAQAPYARMITPTLEVRVTDTGSGPAMPIPSPLKPLTRPTAAPRPAPVARTPAPNAATPNPPAPSAREPVSGLTPSPSSEEAPPDKKPRQAPKAAPDAGARETAGAGRPAQEETAPASQPPQKETPHGGREQAKEPERDRSPAPSPTSKPSPAATPAKTAATAAPKPQAPETEPAPKPEPALEPAETDARAKPKEKAPEATPRATAATTASNEEPPTAVKVDADACILLLHIDVADVLEDADHARLQYLLRRQSGWRVASAATYGGGRAMGDQALELIAAANWKAPPPRVALIQDGSQPPITENLRFLRAVRAAAGEHAQLLLALIGDPGDDEHDSLPPLSEFDFHDWQRKIEQMADPYLRLVMLADAEDGQA